jgi:hypothetical protein
MRTEIQDIKIQSNNSIQNFQCKQKQNKPKELLNANENCPFEPTSTRETSKSQLPINH